MSKSEALAELGKMLSAVGGIMAVAAALHGVAVTFEMINVEKELERIMGKEWVEACRKDVDCRLKLMKIAEESLEVKARTPEEERRKYREKIFNELAGKLKEIGVKIWCEEHDLGELGSYKECYIEYKGYSFKVEKLED